MNGFYEPLIYGEDVDLHRRLQKAGFLIKKVNAIEWHIGEPKTLREFILKKSYYSKVLKLYLNRDRRVILTHLNPFKVKVVRNILKKPSVLIFGFFVVLIAEYMVTFLGLIT